MTLQVTGTNVDASDAFQNYVLDKVSAVLAKYIGPKFSGHVRLEKAKNHFRTNCSIRLRSGLTVEAHGTGVDAYASADMAVDHLDKRVRRYKRRLRDHHQRRESNNALPAEVMVRDYVLQLTDDETSSSSEPDNPVIIAENQRGIQELTVGEAVMHLDLAESPFLIFRNAADGQLNIVYRRPDGNVGWIDPNADMMNQSMNGTRPANR